MAEKTIEVLCEKFHTTIDNLIPTYVHYATTKDLIVIGIWVAISIISICIISFFNKQLKRKNQTLIDDLPLGYCMVVLIAFLLIVFGACIISIKGYDYILWITNPNMRFFDFISPTC